MNTDEIKAKITSAEVQAYILEHLGRKPRLSKESREDVRSEFTIYMLEKTEISYRNEAKFETWLSKIINNFLIDREREIFGREYGRKQKAPEDVVKLGESAVILYDLMHNQGFKRIHEAFEQLKVIVKPPPTWADVCQWVDAFPNATAKIRQFESLEKVNPEQAPNQDKIVETRQLLRKALAQFTPQQKLAITLYADKSLDEAKCRQLFASDISWDTCRRKVTRLLHKAREIMEDKA